MSNKTVYRIASLVILALVLLSLGIACKSGKETTATSPPPTATLESPTQIRPTDGMLMVYVPAGEFQMGSGEEDIDYAMKLCNKTVENCERSWFEREMPMHKVAIEGFWIDQTEVTQAQFAAFLTSQGNKTEDGMPWFAIESVVCLIERKGNEYRVKQGYENYPITEVNWYGARAYCKWAGARLPTEAEWEFAARGPEGKVYPWGDTFDGTKLNFCDTNCTYGNEDNDYNDGYGRVAPVGSFPDGVSWCGALDMAGNAWEWVADWYGDYPAGRQENPTGPDRGEYRVLRGGSWQYPSYKSRSAFRHWYLPAEYGFNRGFRCVRDAGTP